jgi:DNA-binding NarL/FixJ family response regulator
MTAARAIGVLLVDDHPLVRSGLAGLFASTDDVRVVGEAADGAEALVAVDELAPDVVLMDISMPVMNGFDAARSIRDELPDACILFLTGSNAPADIAAARDAGGSGYVTKDKIASELVDAIRAAAPPCG